MWDFFIKNNRFAYLCLIGLILLGSYALSAIPRESSPEVIIPVGIVTTVLPGAPAADVESLVTNELERGLVSLENVTSITSNSTEGFSSIAIEFEARADVDESIQSLKDEIDLLAQSLPDSAEDPIVSEVNFVDQPILSFSISGSVPDAAFTTLAIDVEDVIEGIPGISRVAISGVRDQEVSVLVDQGALAQFGVSLTDVSNAIGAANTVFPVGQITNAGIIYNVAFEGDIESPEHINRIGITERGGVPVTVADVADVRVTLSPASTLSRVSVAGEPSQSAITFSVYKQTGGDITSLARTVHDNLDILQEKGGLLDGYTVSTVYDSGADIENDLRQLTGSGLQTVALVVLLLVLAIGWREGLLAGLAIPLTFLIGFIGLYYSGNTINFLSLFSLILGIGILVDSSIVMVEGINRKMKDDPTIDKREAAIAAIHEFKAPLIAGTLTTVAMFVGLFIVSGVIGQFIASIPFTLVFLLFASMFVSLTIIPLLATSALRRRSTTRFEKLQQAYTAAFEDWYRSVLYSLLRDARAQKRFIWTIRGLLVAAISLPIIGAVPVIFFAQSDVDFVIVEIEHPEGTAKEVVDISARRVEEVLYQKSYIDSYTLTVGQRSEFTDGATGEKLANFLINLSDERVRTSTEVVADLQQSFTTMPDISITVSQPSDGPPTGAAVIVKFLGDDLDQLTRITNDAANLITEIPEAVNVAASTDANSTEFVLTLDRAKAAQLGVNLRSVSQLVRTAVYGTEATSITTLREDIPVVVQLNIANQASVTNETANEATIDALTRITVPTMTGSVPLSSLVSVSLRESSARIQHEDGKRIVSLTADVAPGENALEVQSAVIAKITDTIDLPAGVTISTGGGESEDSNKAFIEMGIALIVGIVLMFAVLLLQFNSFRYTRYVLSILPYSLIGILFGLAATQNPLSFPSMMGFIALSGIVVNNAILLIDQMNQLRIKQPDMEMIHVVVTAAVSRLRPIVLTTITTICGMIPLTMAGDIWIPLAFAVMFGLIFSVIITLGLIPVTYLRKPGVVKQ